MRALISKIFIVSAFGFTIFSCDDGDEEIQANPESEFDVELEFSESGPDNKTEFVNVDANVQRSIKARVTITSTTEMERVYITRNIAGAGDEPFTPSDLSNRATKGDGSLDVSNTSGQLVDYELDLNVPAGVGENGSVVYRFWATSGKGDYRDVTKRFVAGVGTIEMTFGDGNNPAATIKSFSATMLASPLANGSSETFLSLLDGEVYRIDQGEEFSALWDFGYYYGATGEASLASAGNYPSSIIDVEAIANTTDAELNDCFFQLSTMSSAEFDAVVQSSDLDAITKSDDERITNLNIGDIIQFVDNYGKKGLIEVTSILPGFGLDGQITINVKVQP